MNTKFFLLLVCLMTATHTFSVIHKKMTTITPKTIEQTFSSSNAAQEIHLQPDITHPEPISDHGTNHAEKEPKEHEDGKHHSFHFSRVPASRRRNLVVVIGKFVLTVLHICLFIYCFMHPFH